MSIRLLGSIYCIIIFAVTTSLFSKTGFGLEIKTPSSSEASSTTTTTHTDDAYKRHKNACLTKTSLSGHNINSIEDYDGSLRKMQGVTYWINDFLAVGHLMYDIVLLDLLVTEQINSVVIQRAPCFTKDLCSGNQGGTMASFFRTYFTLLTSISLNKKLLVYSRSNPKDNYFRPLELSPHSVKMAKKNDSWIPVREKTCFDTVITRSCQSCFHDFVKSASTMLFQDEVRLLLKSQNSLASGSSVIIEKDSKHYKSRIKGEKNVDYPYFRITYGYRGSGHYRELSNHRDVMANVTRAIKKYFPKIDLIANFSGFLYDIDLAGYKLGETPEKKKIIVSIVDTSHFLTPIHQIEVAHLTNVMISTHGAFESNLIYMRRGTKWVEIGSDSLARESADFHQLANAFGIDHIQVVAKDLQSRRQIQYRLSWPEELLVSGYLLAAIKEFAES